MPKVFSLEWAFEPFQEHETFATRHMFGGKAAYVHGRMVMCLAEDPNDSVWNGILFPTEREHHESLQGEFSSLVPHSILPKWLYLPCSAADFEEVAAEAGRLIARDDARFGIYPKPKSKKKRTVKKKAKKKTKKVSQKRKTKK